MSDHSNEISLSTVAHVDLHDSAELIARAFLRRWPLEEGGLRRGPKVLAELTSEIEAALATLIAKAQAIGAAAALEDYEARLREALGLTTDVVKLAAAAERLQARLVRTVPPSSPAFFVPTTREPKP